MTVAQLLKELNRFSPEAAEEVEIFVQLVEDDRLAGPHRAVQVGIFESPGQDGQSGLFLEGRP